MPKGRLLYQSSGKIGDLHHDVYDNLPQIIVMRILNKINSFQDLQNISNAHAGMKELIESDDIKPLRRRLLIKAVEQLKAFINRCVMNFFTASADWPRQVAAELNNLNSLSDVQINKHYQTLIAYLAKPGLQDEQCRTPLLWAADYGHLEIVKALLAQPDIDANKADDCGRTLLYCAAYYGQLEIVKVLLAQSGIDVNKADDGGRTPLYWAASCGHLEIVKVLLAQPGIDANKANNAGRTPLYWAAYYGHLEIVKELLAQPGIDANKADEYGTTPSYWAERYGHSEISTLIKNHIAMTNNSATGSRVTPGYTALHNNVAADSSVGLTGQALPDRHPTPFTVPYL